MSKQASLRAPMTCLAYDAKVAYPRMSRETGREVRSFLLEFDSL